jgi:hypothetical protein
MLHGRTCRLAATSIALASLGAGCGLDISRRELHLFAPAYPVVHEYSRNAAVCVPTMVGNVIGATAASLLVTPPYVLLHLTPWRESERAEAVLLSVALGPILAGGVITGTPFLPLAYVGREQPCGFH